MKRWSLLLFAGTSSIVIACTGDARDREPPPAEFLIAAGDSTWWVESEGGRFSIRSAPILLTRTDETFYEVFVTMDASEYEDASLLSARIYARDVAADDSVLLFHDSTVTREIERWKREHPGEVPLTPNEEAEAGEPETIISDDIEIIDVHGPWVTFAHAVDIDVAGRPDHLHTLRRGVVDTRNGNRATLASIFGETDAARAIAEGQRQLEEFKDSVRMASDERAARAREVLESFRFDASSFAITDVNGHPAVAFISIGSDTEGAAIPLDLPPIEMPSTSWWNDVRSTLPQWSRDSSALYWNQPHYQVRASLSADATALDLTLHRIVADSNGVVSYGRAWHVTTVAMPAYQLIALDNRPLATDMRSALSRAFNRSAAREGSGMQVGDAMPQRSHSVVAVSSVKGSSISMPSRATRVRGKTIRASRSNCCTSRE